MNTQNKRKDATEDNNKPKRVKKECSYGDNCYRKNPAHFREFSHTHLENIIDTKQGDQYIIPPQYSIQKHQILEQIEIIVSKELYTPKSASSNSEDTSSNSKAVEEPKTLKKEEVPLSKETNKPSAMSSKDEMKPDKDSLPTSNNNDKAKGRDSDYRPIVPPTRRIQDFLKVVAPTGKMAEKHAARAPYYIFYTTITDAKETHSQEYSITFQEILDSSLGELKCSLQINFMVELGWLLAQYYFAGYSNKKMTILYGDETPDLKTINQKKPHIDTHHVKMPTPFGTHHTKMMILCYEDGSLRVVVSTANLYIDDWENRTQGLWFSPKCPELPPSAMPHDGESPTFFKRCLLKYLNHYYLPQLAFYVERVKRCDFSHINVFLIASVPGSHFDMEWGLTRAGHVLRQHCAIPSEENGKWPLIAQASSLGSYGQQPKLWLTGDFQHHFTRVKNHPQVLSQQPSLKLIYPSLENVRQSHDGLLGGGCLPYSADVNTKQPWLVEFLHQWRATHTNRNKAMPHIKSYSRLSPAGKMAAYYLLTSANVSKAAWGSINKGNAALRIMSYEAGVMFIPQFVIKKDFFSLDKNDADHLLIPYDLPPVRYEEKMSPWVSDYLQ